MTEPTRIDVLICTFRRPELAATLASLATQILPPEIVLAVIVSDNDTVASAKQMVADLAADFPHSLAYIHAPSRNISIARNAGLDRSQAAWVGFIDDDETARPDWIAGLWRTAKDSGADAVFGPAKAVYPPGTPAWMTELDYHSNIPERRGGAVMTGHTCNALLRWHGADWADCRFAIGRGRSGGEDTAFFFDIARRGAKFAESTEAIVHEAVDPARLSLQWLIRRRFRMGQSYASSASGFAARLGLLISAVFKTAICAVATLATLPSASRRNFWLMRGILQAGVVAGCLALPQPQVYGGD